VLGQLSRNYYDNACCQAELRNYDKALEELRHTAIDPECKAWARTDASFAELRDPYERTKPPPKSPSKAEIDEFYRLVGEATTWSFTTLEPLAKHEAALRAIGVRQPKDLIALTETEAQRAALATDLSVPKRAIRQWSDIAGLAAVACAGPKPGDKREQYLLGQVALLLAANVDSVKALRHAMTATPFSDFADRLKAEAVGSGVPPPSKSALEAWSGSGTMP
jgi:Domain of unknown function (DUF4332)